MAARFFCENCKFEVGLDVDRCPYCGKVFYSVFCPRCKKEGFASEFNNGCPQCGYLTEGYKSSRKKSIFRDARNKKIYPPRSLYTGLIIILLFAIIGLGIYIVTSGILR